MLSIVVLFLISLSALSNQECLADVYLPNLMQDQISIIISGTQMIEKFEYPLMLFDQEPNFGFTVNRIEWEQIHHIQYSLSHSFAQNSLIVSYQEPQFHAKSVVRVIGLTVWVSSRKDLVFGTTFLRNIEPLSHSTQETKIPTQTANLKIENIKVFVSLLSMDVLTEMEYFHIDSNAEVTQNNGKDRQKFPLKLISNVSCGHHTSVNQIALSFIILTPSSLDQHSHHYSSLQTQIKFSPFETTTSFNAFINSPIEIFPLEYALVGLTGMRVTGTSKLALQFELVSKNLDFLSIKSSSSIDELSFNLLILGNNMMMACIQCPDSYVVQKKDQPPQCISQFECEKILFKNDEKMMFACKDCASELNMQLFANQSQYYCQCKEGYTLGMSNKCEKIFVANAVSDQKCSDPLSERNLTTNKCECKAGFTEDFFGFCSLSCSMANSYWDYDSRQCLCFTGYKKVDGNCVELQADICGQNENLVDGKCVCNSRSIYSETKKTCIFCETGTYKNEKTSTCDQCSIKCRQCLSQELCLNCNEGYFLKDLKCLSICGDGFRVSGEECDDGNKDQGDGCSSQCTVEDQFSCEQQVNQADICLKVAKKQESVNKTQTTPSPLSKSTNNCKLSLVKKPIYLNGGIVLEVSIEPVKKLEQQQINNLFQVIVDHEEGRPSTVYVSQYEEKLSYFRIYLHYNNQLPTINFLVTINIWFEECREKKWLKLNSFVLDYEISDALSISRGNDELL